MASVVTLAVRGDGADPAAAAAASVGLARRGHQVVVVADPLLAAMVRAAGVEAIDLPPGLLPPATLRTDVALLHACAQHLAGWAEPLVRQRAAAVVLSSGLASPAAAMAAQAAGTGFAVVHGSYLVGPGELRAVEDDVVPASVQVVRDYLVPLLAHARLVLHTTDPVFDPVAALPPRTAQVGPLRWETATAPPPPWLDAPGEPWVLMVMPEEPSRGDEEIAAAVIGELAGRAVRVVLTVPEGRGLPATGALPPNVAAVRPFAPGALLARGAALVMGPADHALVSQAVRAGVPALVVPWRGDQPGVAWRLCRLGAGMSVVPDGDVAGSAADAANRLLSDGRYAAEARRAAAEAGRIDPMTAAVIALESLLGPAAARPAAAATAR
jgi:UDP:flavonoid glycosyltransferase YjiC (YdhE family)